MSILLSIKPKYAEKILSGEKKYEYRRAPPKQMGTVYLYATSPVCKVVGEFTYLNILQRSAEALWEQTGAEGGITRDEFFGYFAGAKTASALVVSNPIRYDPPASPRDLGTDIPAPPSYCILRPQSMLNIKLHAWSRKCGVKKK